MYRVVCGACHISEVVFLGLYIQYGGERCSGRGTKLDVELVQLREVSEVRTLLGDVAWVGGCLDHNGDESGVAGFPAVVGLLGCA
jgi:hypothetical protein